MPDFPTSVFGEHRLEYDLDDLESGSDSGEYSSPRVYEGESYAKLHKQP